MHPASAGVAELPNTPAPLSSEVKLTVPVGAVAAFVPPCTVAVQVVDFPIETEPGEHVTVVWVAGGEAPELEVPGVEVESAFEPPPPDRLVLALLAAWLGAGLFPSPSYLAVILCVPAALGV